MQVPMHRHFALRPRFQQRHELVSSINQAVVSPRRKLASRLHWWVVECKYHIRLRHRGVVQKRS